MALGLAVLEPFVRSWLAAERTRADHDTVLRERLLDEVTTDRATVSRDAVERARPSRSAGGWRTGTSASTCAARTGTPSITRAPYPSN
ncbi:hypothetical protein ACFU8Q_28565 [Streptomyces sp. NPDC057543]|uniref:hypothetical protein n=1 Tax=Streptomyces sp. NPDC057543 TaxID=3346163 RepID=UPI0036A5C261